MAVWSRDSAGLTVVGKRRHKKKKTENMAARRDISDINYAIILFGKRAVILF